MMNQMRNGLLGAALLLTLAAGGAWACGDPAGMTHVGVVSAVDSKAGTLVLLDAQTGRNLTFRLDATPAGGVRVKDHVVIHYSEQDGVLVIEEIVKS